MIATADNGAAVATDYDSQQMTRIESGNVDAFDELYDRYSARAYGVARCASAPVLVGSGERFKVQFRQTAFIAPLL